MSNADCAIRDSCYLGDTPAGSLCVRECARDADCGAGFGCLPVDGTGWCIPRCETDDECRVSWQCHDPVGYCTPSCTIWGCLDADVCDAPSGVCFEDVPYEIAVNQVAIAPGKPNKMTWDLSQTVSDEIFAAVLEALGVPAPLQPVLEALAAWALRGFAPPDIRGTLTIRSYGQVVCEYVLPDGANEDSYAPGWRNARCSGVSLLPDARTSLSLVLVDDESSGGPEAVGTVVIGDALLRQAATAGTPFTVNTSEQGLNSVLLVVISVLR